MKKIFLNLAAALITGSLWAANQCIPRESSVIDSEVRCVPQGGINIGIGDDDGATAACMASKEVQGRCGPDGSLTRLHAYAMWFNKLKQFESSCSSQGGVFSYQDPNFTEPQDESYCLQAIPEVGSNMFEEPLCNFRSICPAVTVVCDKPCSEHTVAQAF
jgi:hypothetical protein